MYYPGLYFFKNSDIWDWNLVQRASERVVVVCSTDRGRCAAIYFTGYYTVT